MSKESDKGSNFGDEFVLADIGPGTPSKVSKPKETDPYGHGWVVYLGIFLLIVGVGGYIYFSHDGKKFPKVGPGSFIGEFKGIIDSEKHRFYLERAEGANSLLFVILEQGWKPELIDLASMVIDDEQGEWIYPPTLVSEKGTLRFVGGFGSNGGLSGEVFSLKDGRKGSWSAEPVSITMAVDPTEAQESEVKLWLNLKEELGELEAKIIESESTVQLQRAQIDKLSKYITEGVGLKARAQEKYDQAFNELVATRKILKSEQAQAKDLASQLAISERVTGIGKLAALARETADRESRWVETYLKSYVDTSSPDFKKAFSRAEEIFSLKREVARLKGELFRLTHPVAEPLSVAPDSGDGVNIR